jgi:choline dehydrogenase-like flavoprotein
MTAAGLSDDPSRPGRENEPCVRFLIPDAQALAEPRVLVAKTNHAFAFSSRRLRHSFEQSPAAGATEIFPIDWGPDTGWHLLRTSRMGQDPDTSVVDQFGRTHDVPNLFIVDGSVFVTSSSANPTSTISAIALRAAEHILQTAPLQAVPA